MEMDAILNELQSSSMKTKLSGLERLLDKLKKQVDLRSLEMRKKVSLFDEVVSAAKDANPKVVMMSLECIQVLIQYYTELFNPNLNMTFYALIIKLSDSKEYVREAAKETLLSVINELGAVSGFEKVLAQLEHKNWRIREQILQLILYMLDEYGEEVATAKDLTSLVSSQLSDAQITIRNSALEILARLYTVFGDVLLVDLGSNEKVKQSHIKAIKEIANNEGLEIAIPRSNSGLGRSGSLSSMSSDQGSPNTTISNASSTQRKNRKAEAARQIPSIGSTGRVSSFNLKDQLSSTTGQIPTFSRNSSTNSAASGDSTKDVSNFSPQWYLGLLAERRVVQTLYPSSEKDLMKIFSSIIDEIGKTDDWQARVGGLGRMQALATGVCYMSNENGDESIKNAFIQQMKSSSATELICSQVIDLRSAVCKEACCTVATLARTLRNSFSQLARLFIPSLLKVLTQKIFVITAAADRCLRIVVSSPNASYYPKVIDTFMDTISTSKNSQQKKKSFDYLTMAMAIWRFSDVMLDKMLDGLKKVVGDGVKDANADVRKSSRHLFWVLRSIPQYERVMDKTLQNFDSSTRKHINQELQTASEDFIELLNNPTGGLEDVQHEYSPDEGQPTTEISHASRDSGPEPNGSYVHDKSTDNNPPPLPSQVMPRQGPSRVNSFNSEQEPNDNQLSKTSKLGSSIRSGSGPARVIRGVGGNARRTESSTDASSGRGIDDTLPPPPSEIPPSGRSAVAPISSSIRNKSAGRIARQNSEASRRSIQQRFDDENQNDQNKAEGISSRVMHSSGAQRVAVQPSVRKSTAMIPESRNGKTTADCQPESKRSDRHANTMSSEGFGQNTGSLSHSVTEIRSLIQDSRWENRVMGFEAIDMRFMKWLASFHDETTGTSTFPPYLEEFLDSCIHHLSDSHHKVVGAVSGCLETLCRAKQNPLVSHRLSILLATLLTRLGDRKASVRTQSSSLLDMILESYDAPHIVSALSPRMTELPERTRISLVQFLIGLIPQCEVYFNVQGNMSAFLSRLVIVLGLNVGTFSGATQRASSSLTVAGQRLLELLYSTSKEALLSQLAALPLQHQNALKKLMEGRIPNIDSLVSAAGRQEWVHNQSHPPDHRPPNLESVEDCSDVDAADLGVSDERFGTVSGRSVDQDESPFGVENTSRVEELSSRLSGQYLSDAPQTKESSSSPTNNIINVQSAPLMESHTKELSGVPPSTPNNQDECGRTMNQLYSASTSSHLSASPAADHTPTHKKDVAWLLEVLRPDGASSRDSKKAAIVELKKWSRNATEKFWRVNSAQIISVLLEAFNPAMFSKTNGVPFDSSTSPSMQALTGLTPPSSSRPGDEKSSSKEEVLMMEAMHISCKGLILMVKVEGGVHMEAFLELLVARLCNAASFAPVAVSLHCEQILSLASALDPFRFSKLLLPIISGDGLNAPAHLPSNDSYQHTRLLALHALSSAVSHLKSSDLLSILPDLSASILPHFSSPLVDIRKSVVFVLVEVYMKVGDSLYPFVKDLAASQRKLLTVYIERQMKRNSMAKA